MKKLCVFLTIMVFCFLIISCETNNLPTNASKTSSEELFDSDVEKIEISESDLALINNYPLEKSSDKDQRDAVIDEVLLKYFAMAVAKSLKHPDICKIIKSKTGEKFDGDYDVLWEQIKNTQISGQDMRELVNSRFSDKAKQILSMEMIEEVPLLQISLPVNFDNWDGESTILVAYTPLTTDDMEWEEIYSYDADLKEYVLNAKTEPDFPVMVVGINERDKFISNSYIAKISDIMTEYRTEILDKIKILDDHEPWTSGDPEIYIVSAGTREQQGMSNRVNLTHVNEENQWYYTDVNLFEWNTITWGDFTGFGVLEYDPDGYNYEITVLEENFKVKIKEKSDGNDDYLGCINSVGYDEDSGTQYDFGDVKMVLKY